MQSDEHGVHMAPLNGEFGLTFKHQIREDLEKSIQELGLEYLKMDLEAAHTAPTLKVLWGSHCTPLVKSFVFRGAITSPNSAIREFH